MKKIIILWFVFLCGFPLYVNAVVCSVDNAKIVSVFQWSDGNIFIEFDKNSNCPCTIPSRMAFNKIDDEKFFVSAALTAYASGKPVMAQADGSCTIHANTSKLIVLQVK